MGPGASHGDGQTPVQAKRLKQKEAFVYRYHTGYESESESCSVMSDSLQPHGLYSPWNSPGQNTGVGSLSLLQGIFLTQGSNPGLPHGRQILYQLSHKGSPRILEWVAYPFSCGSSRPRTRTRISCNADRLFLYQLKALIISYVIHLLTYLFPPPD